MKTTVIAFDPGKTTGVCQILVADDGKSFEAEYCDEIQWHNRIEGVYNILLQPEKECIVVIESFRLFPHKAMAQVGSQFPSAQVTGIIEALAFTLNYRPDCIKFQEPGDISRVAVQDEHIPLVVGSAHKTDAYRHARLYFLKHFYINPFS